MGSITWNIKEGVAEHLWNDASFGTIIAAVSSETIAQF